MLEQVQCFNVYSLVYYLCQNKINQSCERKDGSTFLLVLPQGWAVRRLLLHICQQTCKRQEEVCARQPPVFRLSEVWSNLQGVPIKADLKCRRLHPTCLHFDDTKVKTLHEGAREPVQASAEEAQTEVQPVVSLRVSGGGATNTSTVVPVWVSTLDRPDDEKLVYALLDTQSDTMFVSQEISDFLHWKSEPVRLKQTTMTSRDTIVHCQRVMGLSVRGHSSAMRISLPSAYTRHYIPVDRSHIPTNETAKCWAHLKSIVDELPSLKDCDVGLLIGYTCAQALAPRQVITTEDQEPYAQKTDLGWSIVGCVKPSHDLNDVAGYSHRIAVKEMPTVTPSDAVRLLESDFSDSTQDDKRTSQDNLLFLQKMEGGIRQDEDGHYEMPLPFKSRPQLPDNKRLAIIRLGHLKRKMDRDEMYRNHYSKFMNEVIENGDAEKVISQPASGSSWYIPIMGCTAIRSRTRSGSCLIARHGTEAHASTSTS